LVLHLTAEERTRLRGLRQTRCGQPLLLQLPRGKALLPWEWLAADDGLARVRVDPAAEALLRVQADGPQALLQAAYHLGNRHVALEVRDGEVRLLADPVLEDLLRQRGLRVERAHEPFQPEPGAYGGGGHHPHPPSATDNAPTRPVASASDDD
jgi:urease accessory protein